MRLVFAVTLDLTDEQLDRYRDVYGSTRVGVVDDITTHLTTTVQGDTLGDYAKATVTQVDAERAVGPCTCGAPDEGAHHGRIVASRPEHAYTGPRWPERRACCGQHHEGYPCR